MRPRGHDKNTWHIIWLQPLAKIFYWILKKIIRLYVPYGEVSRRATFLWNCSAATGSIFLGLPACWAFTIRPEDLEEEVFNDGVMPSLSPSWAGLPSILLFDTKVEAEHAIALMLAIEDKLVYLNYLEYIIYKNNCKQLVSCMFIHIFGAYL